MRDAKPTRPHANTSNATLRNDADSPCMTIPTTTAPSGTVADISGKRIPRLTPPCTNRAIVQALNKLIVIKPMVADGLVNPLVRGRRTIAISWPT